MTITSGFAEITSDQVNKDVTNTGTIAADGACVFYATNGIYVYSITIKDANGKVVTAITAPAIAKAMKAAAKGVYNIKGQRVANDVKSLPNGLYIVDVKKVVKQ